MTWPSDHLFSRPGAWGLLNQESWFLRWDVHPSLYRIWTWRPTVTIEGNYGHEVCGLWQDEKRHRQQQGLTGKVQSWTWFLWKKIVRPCRILSWRDAAEWIQGLGRDGLFFIDGRRIGLVQNEEMALIPWRRWWENLNLFSIEYYVVSTIIYIIIPIIVIIMTYYLWM